eukprot:5870553-Pyramimonas_sp.AAC.1
MRMREGGHWISSLKIYPLAGDSPLENCAPENPLNASGTAVRLKAQIFTNLSLQLLGKPLAHAPLQATPNVMHTLKILAVLLQVHYSIIIIQM